MQRVISNQTVWHAQTGGQTNKVWRLIGEEDLICKLYLETGNNPLFNNTPEEEYRCLLWLEGSNIAPKPYKFLKTPFGEVLIYNYIKGQIWSQNVDSVSELLTRIRKHIYPKGLRVLSNLPSDIKQIGLEIINELNSYHKNKLIKICPDVSIPDIEPVLLHTDVVPGNLILADEGLRLIDWQCPAIGDPIVDIMMFLSPGMHEIYGSRKLSMKEHETFLMNLTSKLRNRYNILAPLYHWRLAAYCFWKAEQGFIEYEKAALAEIDLLKMI
jgi:thiamine kinase-like enzyme